MKLVLQCDVFSVFSTAIKTSCSHGNFSNRNYEIRALASCPSISRTSSVNILSILGTWDSAVNMRKSLPAIVTPACQQERKPEKRQVRVCVYVHMCTCLSF